MDDVETPQDDLATDLAADLATEVRAEMRADMAAMRAELRALRDELDGLRAERATVEPEPAVDEVASPDLVVTSRRRLFALAGGAAAAAVAVATTSRATPVAAANGDPVSIAQNTIATGNVISTFLNYSATTSNTNNRHLFVVGDASAAFNPAGDQTAAVSGYAANRISIGVSGVTTVPGGLGVSGRSSSGTGVYAASDNGWALQAGGTGRIYIAANVPVGPPVGTFSQGEIIRDGQNDLWICFVGGASPRFRKLGGGTTAGSLHIIDPTRVYDSRLGVSGGRLANTDSRVVSVANGINLTTGAVSLPNVVPVGATAIQFSFTIADATGQGFLSVTPGDAATYTASTLNFVPATPTLATGALVKLDAARNIKVFIGGGGSANFLIDVTGYYL